MDDVKSSMHQTTIMVFLAKKTATSQKISSIYMSPDIESPPKKQIVGCEVILVNPSREGYFKNVVIIS